MKLGSIREILDKYTESCNDCTSKYFCEQGEVTGCSTLVAKKIKDEIMGLLDQEKVETDARSSIPCKLNFKGACRVLPPSAEIGDTYAILENKLENGYGWVDQMVFYWYDNKWNHVPNPPEHCKIHYA